jgi:hypothetical protein
MSALSTQFGGSAYSVDQPVTETAATVLGPVDVQNYPNLGFYIQSAAGSDDVTEIVVESAPLSSGPWVQVLDIADGTSLEAEAATYGSLSNSAHKFVRVRATCGAGDTATVSTWLCASRYGL